MTENSVSDRSGMRAAVAALALAIGSSYLVLLAIDAETVDRFGWEDGPIESAGALFFLVASAGFLAASIRTIRQSRQAGKVEVWSSVVFALLALLMFVCFGEELSWGQRIFDWQAPPVFTQFNAQNETNLHNIQAVHQWNTDGSEKGFVGKLVNMNRLFSVFWLVSFLVFPLAVRNSDRLRQWAEKLRFPVPPLWTGSLFLGSFLLYKVLAFLQKDTLRAHALDEFKEASYAAIYAFIAVAVLVAGSGRNQDPE